MTRYVTFIPPPSPGLLPLVFFPFLASGTTTGPPCHLSTRARTDNTPPLENQASNGVISRGPSPNRGASVRDVEAIGPDSESKRGWQKKRGIDVSKQVRITKLSHMRYQHPDLNKITTFLRGELSLLLFSPFPQVWHVRQVGHGDEYMPDRLGISKSSGSISISISLSRDFLLSC